MPLEPSVTSALPGPWECTLRYPSALLGKIFERPGPKSVTPARNCSGVALVVWWRWIVAMACSLIGGEVTYRGTLLHLRPGPPTGMIRYSGGTAGMPSATSIALSDSTDSQ